MDRIFYGASVYDTDSRQFLHRFVTVRDDVILSVTEEEPQLPAAERIDCTGLYLLPGLVDVHTHGRAGYDFSTITPENVETMLRAYAEVGTTSVMATLASAPFADWVAAAAMLTEQAGVPHAGAHILGVHYEGRYLSEKRRGAHAAGLLAQPDLAELDRMLAATAGVRTHISIAPELSGSNDFIREAVRRGATVGVAHTDCTYEIALAAIAAGAVSVTHTFNAMSPLHHRAPGCIGASLLTEDAYSELICDGLHSHPAMSKLLYRAKQREKIALITDSMEATDCSDGNYSIAGLPVIVKDGRALTVEGAIAGSTLNLWDGVKNFVSFAGAPLEDAIYAATAAPAKMVGAYAHCGSITAGKSADLLLVRPADLTLQAVVCGGQTL